MDINSPPCIHTKNEKKADGHDDMCKRDKANIARMQREINHLSHDIHIAKKEEAHLRKSAMSWKDKAYEALKDREAQVFAKLFAKLFANVSSQREADVRLFFRQYLFKFTFYSVMKLPKMDSKFISFLLYVIGLIVLISLPVSAYFSLQIDEGSW